MAAKPLDLSSERLGCRRNDWVVERLGTRLGDPVIGQNDQPGPPCGDCALQQPEHSQPPDRSGQELTLVGNTIEQLWRFHVQGTLEPPFSAYCLLRTEALCHISGHSGRLIPLMLSG